MFITKRKVKGTNYFSIEHRFRENGKVKSKTNSLGNSENAMKQISDMFFANKIDRDTMSKYSQYINLHSGNNYNYEYDNKHVYEQEMINEAWQTMKETERTMKETERLQQEMKENMRRMQEERDRRNEQSQSSGNSYNYTFSGSKNESNQFFKDITSKDELKQRHRKLAKLLHPDVGGDELLFVLVDTEYKNLINKM